MEKLSNVANFFIETANDLGDQISNLRLNKLLYFAQGWTLAITGKPLFDEEFKAWQYGPVIPDIYNQYKGKKAIKTNKATNVTLFSEEEYDILIAVQNYYGNFVTSKLVDITHRAKSPWEKARVKSENETIPKEEIETYFKEADKSIINSSFDFINNIEIIEPKRDENGIITVPSQGNNGWEI